MFSLENIFKLNSSRIINATMVKLAKADVDGCLSGVALGLTTGLTRYLIKNIRSYLNI